MKNSFRRTACCVLAMMLSLSGRHLATESTYQSDAYHFTLTYPSGLTLKEYSADHFSLLEGKTFLVDFAVYDIDEWLPFARENLQDENLDCDQPFCLVAVERAVTCCAADGPDGSFYGHSPQIKKSYVSDNGYRIVEFTMKGTEERYLENRVEKETRDLGPCYAVAISDNHTLLVKYALGKFAFEKDASLLKDIVDSIKR